MWSNGWIWIFYHYIKGARQTDQYGFCPSFLSTDPWAIYLPSEADPWVKFPLVYRSVHLFVPTTSLPSSLYELYRNIQLWRPPTHMRTDTYRVTQWCTDTMSDSRRALRSKPLLSKAKLQHRILQYLFIHAQWSPVTLKFTCVRKRKTQSWLICLSRDSSSVAALQLFVFLSIRTPKEKTVCVCMCDSTHQPTSLLRAVTQEHILGGLTPPCTLCNIFFIHMRPVCLFFKPWKEWRLSLTHTLTQRLV